MKSQLKQLITKAGALGVQELGEQMRGALHDVLAMSRLPALGLGYVPWSSYALRPGAVALILNELMINDSRVVIECGIGISTLYVLSSQVSDDIQLVGIDDNLEWIGLIHRYLQRMGVRPDRYRLIHAPIRECRDDGLPRLWYDKKILAKELIGFLKGDNADLLLIDGPKGNLCTQSRLPALPTLRPYLKQDYAVFVDDIDREDERQMAEKYCRDFDLTYFDRREISGGAVLRPKGTRKTMTI